MKEKILKKGIIVLLVILQILQIGGNFLYSVAVIKEGDIIHLKGDHECDSVLEYWSEKYQRWCYKVVWYVYYIDKEDGNKYPAFCVEPAKEGIGTGYESYNASLKKETDNSIWRVLDKGYMGSNYTDWDLECDDDLYSATKIALHGIAENIAPKDRYILGTRSVDGNTVEEIQRRGEKVLKVAQALYEEGINGSDTYKEPVIDIKKQDVNKIETINKISYYIQDYKVIGNKSLKSYEIEIENFPSGTKIFNLNNQEQLKLTNNYFKIAIPVENIIKDVEGKIIVKNAYLKTNPIYYCNSNIEGAQNYVTYTSGYEKAYKEEILNIKANKSNIKIQKIDKETKSPIANVTFEILDKDRNKITEVITNREGIAEFNNLYPQTVVVKEIKVPEPYIISNEEKQIKLEWNKTSNVIFENERKKGNLKIVKVDADDNEIKLENVEFELYNEKGNLVKKVITDKNGEAYVENLEIGKYMLKEIKAKDGYNLVSHRILEIKWNETKVERIENEKQKGQIEVYKVDKDNKEQKLEGVIFEVLDENKQVVEKIITNKDGYAITKKLPIGQYYIREIKTNENYVLNEEILKIEVKHKQVETLEIENERIKGQIEILKISEDDNLINGNKKGSPIENVEFEIRKEDGEIVEKIITNKDGIAITCKLEKGVYIVKETKANDDYIITNEEFKLEIIENGKVEKLIIRNPSKEPEIPKLPRTGF